jgi:phosphate acetyltransferase
VRKRLLAVGSAKIRPDSPVARPHIPANRASPTSRECGHHHQQLVRRTMTLKPIRIAVVHPVDTDSLLGAIEAAKANLIIPVLVGPHSKIRAAANQAKIEISAYELVPTEHSHAAAAQAVELACDHKVEALMKASLRTDEFMGAIVHEEKFRTSRRMSHVFVIDVHKQYHYRWYDSPHV